MIILTLYTYVYGTNPGQDRTGREKYTDDQSEARQVCLYRKQARGVCCFMDAFYGIVRFNNGASGEKRWERQRRGGEQNTDDVAKLVKLLVS